MHNQQLKQFQAALLRAFPSRAALAQMVRFGLDESLAVLAGDAGGLAETVFALLEWAEAHGKLDTLLAAAREANPGNPELRAFADGLASPPAGPAPPAPSPPAPAPLADPAWRAQIGPQLARLEERRVRDLCFLRLDVDFDGLPGADAAAKNRRLIALMDTPDHRAELTAAVAEALAQQARARTLAGRITTRLDDAGVARLWQALDLAEGPPPDAAAATAVRALIARAEETGQFAALVTLIAEIPRLVLRGHTDVVNSAAWSPDGRAIVTGSSDKTAKVWDAATGQERATLGGHTDELYSPAWSPDGRAIVTASADGTAIIWDAPELP